MNINIFETYWNILKRNYQDKTHTTEDMKLYYAIFKNYSERDIKIAIRECLKYQTYFPRIDELHKYLPQENENLYKVTFDKDGNMLWDGKRCETRKLNEEEKKELERLLEEMSSWDT